MSKKQTTRPYWPDLCARVTRMIADGAIANFPDVIDMLHKRGPFWPVFWERFAKPADRSAA